MENNITIKALNYKLFKMKRIYNIFRVYSQENFSLNPLKGHYSIDKTMLQNII